MDSMYKILRREICALRDGDDTGLEHFSRRSTFVLHRDSAANHQNTNSFGELDAPASTTRGLPRSTGPASRRNLGGLNASNHEGCHGSGVFYIVDSFLKKLCKYDKTHKLIDRNTLAMDVVEVLFIFISLPQIILFSIILI
jgi:hypothetical protein